MLRINIIWHVWCGHTIHWCGVLQKQRHHLKTQSHRHDFPQVQFQLHKYGFPMTASVRPVDQSSEHGPINMIRQIWSHKIWMSQWWLRWQYQEHSLKGCPNQKRKAKSITFSKEFSQRVPLRPVFFMGRTRVGLWNACVTKPLDSTNHRDEGSGEEVKALDVLVMLGHRWLPSQP